jgi:hypothetical protein
MKAHKKSKSIRRSVALPESLATEAMAVAPDEPKKNFNRIVVLALTEFVAARKREAFAKSTEINAALKRVLDLG